MKRVNLSVDLEDSDILTEEIKKVVLAQSKQIAREVTNEHLVSEIERIVKTKVDNLEKAGPWSAVYSNIADNVAKVIEHKLKHSNMLSEMIDTLLVQKLEEILEKRLKKEVDIDSVIESYLKKSIASALANPSP